MQVNGQNSLRGIVFAVSAFTIWVLGNAFTKIAAEAHLPSYEVVCFMGAVGALIVGFTMWLKGNLRSLRPKKPIQQFILALLYLLGDMCNVVSFRHISLPAFYTIAFTSPLIVALLAVLFLKERLPGFKVAAILLGFGGAVFAVHPWDGMTAGDAVDYLAAFGNGAFWSASVIITRKLSFSESMESMVFSNGLVQALCCGLVIPVLGPVPIGGHYALVLAAAGALQIAGVFCFYTAAKSAPASTIAPSLYSQIVTGAVVSYAIFHIVPTWQVFVGAAIIIAAGLYMASKVDKDIAQLT